MALLAYIDAPSQIHRIDPRARLAVCAILLVALAGSSNPYALSAAWGLSALAIMAARLPFRLLTRRLLAVNLFLLAWWTSVPLLDAGRGVALAWSATAKANAMVLLVSLLVSTIEAATLAHALAHLRVPRKLVHLLLFTVRYAEVLWTEQQRMQRAMRARAFRPRMNAHTYRALTRLVGMLLVRSLDRADRVLAAMKCRGYRGEFFLLHHFHFHPRDACFAATGLVLAAFLAYVGRA